MNLLRSAFGDEFRESLRAPLAGISVGSMLAALSSVPWATVGPALAGLITAVGGAGIGLRTQWKLSKLRVEDARIKVAMAELELEAFRLKVRGTRPEDLHPEEIGREIREHEQGRCAAAGPGDPAHP